ncbi:MAG: ribosome maturation factor RimP [Burkholderiales bacterium]|jgi:ribosome maturation factor RimP|nr:ribosome maturation factor RimP [Betaproteobacteria bacterium]
MKGADEIVRSVAAGLGFDVIDIERAAGGRLLRVFIDKPWDGVTPYCATGGGDGVTIDDCTLLSNQLTRVFMVEAVDYERLEVSSPGLDRTIRREQDFPRFVGQRMRVSLRLPIDGRTRVLVGELLAAGGGTLTVQVDNRTHTVEIGNVEKARLVPAL